MPCSILVVPGIGDSGPGHWQTIWEHADGSMVRVHQAHWEYPVCGEWMEVLDKAVRKIGEDTIIIAHSLGALLVAHWAARYARKIRGAMMVAPPDPGGPAFPSVAQGFKPVPLMRLPFQTLVVSSSNDPYGTPQFAQQCADAWGGRHVCIGEAGHINGESQLGAWPEGMALLRELY
jgi:uncharacterized protein